jgi:hypothetical protein
MKKAVCIIVFQFLLLGTADAAQVTLLPETWFEIYHYSTDTLSIKPDTIRVGRIGEESRGFWEYSLSGMKAQLSTIDSAFIYFRSIGNKENSLIDAYKADLTPTYEDWNNDAASFGNAILKWSSTSAVGDLSTEKFDITNWLIFAINNELPYLGLMAQAHYDYRSFPLNEFLPFGEIIVTGSPANPVPLPSSMLLFGTGLVGLIGYMRLKSHRGA